MKKLSIFKKTFIYTLTIMSFIVILVHLLFTALLPFEYMNWKQDEAIVQINAIEDVLRKGTFDENIAESAQYAALNNVNITLFYEHGVYRFKGFTPSELSVNQTLYQFDKATGALIVDQETSSTNQYPIIIREKDSYNKDGMWLKVQLISSVQPLGEIKAANLRMIPYSLSISFIVSLIAAYFYSNRLTQPIKDIVSVTQDMENLVPDSRIHMDRQDEFGVLAENINALYGSLWSSIESLETKVKDNQALEQEKVDFLRAASHELKTPLTSVQLLLENMEHNIGKYQDRDHYLKEAQDMIETISKMLQEILFASNIKTHIQNDSNKTTNLSDVLQETLNTYDILIKSKHLNLVLDIEEGIEVNGSRDLYSKVLSNIVSNAVRYTQAHNSILVHLDKNVLSIENETQSLSEYEQKKVFNAFYRPDYSRNRHDGGNGLGLYIVASALKELDLQYSFEESDTGMIFKIFL